MSGPNLNRMRKALATVVAGYLAVGILFAVETLPQQTWVCPAPRAPHGTVTIGGRETPPRSGCEASVSFADRAEWTAFATAAWLPLVVGKGLDQP